jgi:hypothetical protein
MRKSCGQPVVRSWINLGRICARLSTSCAVYIPSLGSYRVQLPVAPKLSVSFAPYVSPAKTPLLPLIEHYLYPVSTVPINILQLNKFKER